MRSSASSPASTHTSQRVRLFLLATLILATVAVYLPVLGHEFVSYDDPHYVTTNPLVTGGITPAGAMRAFSEYHLENWHPLTLLSHMLDVELFGLAPRGHHLTSLLLHVANVALLFLLLNALTGAPLRSAAVAALFALHPLQVESVAWVAERKNVLSLFFGLLAMTAYLRLMRKPSAGRRFVVVLLFGLSLMSKPMFVSLPFALLLLDFWPLGRFQPGRGALTHRDGVRAAILEKIPLLLLACASCMATYRAQAQAVVSSLQLPLATRCANALSSYLHYLGKMALPHELAVFYPHPGTALAVWDVALASSFLLIATGLALKAWRRHPYLATGWFWYLGTLVPVIGFVQVGSQGSADRYTYLPLIGMFVLIVWGIADALERWRHTRNSQVAVTAAGLALLLLLSLITRVQVGYWHDGITLFRHALATTNNNVVAEFNLALLLDAANADEEAIAHYRAALRLVPTDSVGPLKLVRALLRLGKIEEARRESQRVRSLDRPDAALLYELGIAFADRGELSEAAQCYQESLDEAPTNLEARNNLGVVQWRLGRTREALASFAEVVRQNPADDVTLYNMAEILRGQGHYAEAIGRYREVLRLHPDLRAAALGLALAESMSAR